MTRCESAGFTAGAVLAGFPRPPHTEGMVRGLPARFKSPLSLRDIPRQAGEGI